MAIGGGLYTFDLFLSPLSLLLCLYPIRRMRGGTDAFIRNTFNHGCSACNE